MVEELDIIETVPEGDGEELKKITYKERKALPSSAFVFPKERKYPIHDIAHARNALARVAAHGTPEEQAKVKAAVHRKYPELSPKKKEKQSAEIDIESLFEAVSELEDKFNKMEEKMAEEETKSEEEEKKEEESSEEKPTEETKEEKPTEEKPEEKKEEVKEEEKPKEEASKEENSEKDKQIEDLSKKLEEATKSIETLNGKVEKLENTGEKKAKESLGEDTAKETGIEYEKIPGGGITTKDWKA